MNSACRRASAGAAGGAPSRRTFPSWRRLSGGAEGGSRSGGWPRRGSITVAKTVPQLKKFVEEGGTLLAIGSSTALAKQLGLSVENHLVAKDADGKEKSLGRDKFYVPPSVLRAKVDSAHPLAWGM